MMNSTTRLIAVCMLLFLLNSCKQIDVYEKSIPISNHSWKQNYACKGSFEISDTLAYYNIYIVLRHTDTYKYNNIWLNLGLQTPGEPIKYQKQNLMLSDDAHGWYGSGMDDIWEYRKLLNSIPMRFKKKGVYQFSLLNIMRDNPLEGVMSAGVRVEKVRGVGN